MFEEMGLPRGTKRGRYQAQHIIPVEAMDHPVIKKQEWILMMQVMAYF